MTPRVLMIDNYDSFTYNLVQYLAELGAEVVVVRNDQIAVEEIEKLAPDKIVISPGPCTPREAGISVRPSTVTVAGIRFWGFVSATRALVMRSAGRSSMRRASCTASARWCTIAVPACFAG